MPYEEIIKTVLIITGITAIIPTIISIIVLAKYFELCRNIHNIEIEQEDTNTEILKTLNEIKSQIADGNKVKAMIYKKINTEKTEEKILEKV